MIYEFLLVDWYIYWTVYRVYIVYKEIAKWINDQMKIILFGGAFDPPHVGHMTVAQSLVTSQIADEVWYVPVFKHPWAEKLGKVFLTDYDKRVEMLQMMLTKGTKVAHYRDVSFTYSTLEYFSQKYPEHEFSWVMGSEYLSKFDLFLKDHPKLIEYQIYIYPRKGFPMEPLYPNMIPLENVEEIEISSGMIRDKVKVGEDIEGLINPEVKKFIEENKFYVG